MSYDKLYNTGKMPRTEAVINELAEKIGERWRISIANHSPTWWGRSAVDDENYEIIFNKIPGGIEVFWKDKGKAKYDFQKVVNDGRSQFSIKDALLNGPRARVGLNGRYAIVPFTKNEDGTKVSAKNNDIAGTIQKVGEYKQGQVTRNSYSYNKTGKGNVYKTAQNTKTGKQYSYIKFLMVSEKSSGWMYPEIRAGHYDEKMQALANDQIEKLSRPGKALAIAIENDLAEYFDNLK